MAKSQSDRFVLIKDNHTEEECYQKCRPEFYKLEKGPMLDKGKNSSFIRFVPDQICENYIPRNKLLWDLV